MFSLPFSTDPESGTMAQGVLEILESLGCDTSDETSLNMGIVAYNVGTLVAMTREGKLAAPVARAGKTGRNDPCPCGSGRKYKKCCLDKGESVGAVADASPARSNSDIFPRLWDESEVVEYVGILNDILDSETFAPCWFSQERAAKFMEDAINAEPGLMKEADKDNHDAAMEKMDDLAFRYARESGERKKLKKIEDLLLHEVSGAKSDEELRAIGCGIAFALFEEGAKGGESVSPLIPMLFRKAVFEYATGRAHIADLVEDFRRKIGRDNGESLETWLEKDFGSGQEISARLMEGLSEKDKKLIQNAFEQDLDDLWDVLEDGEFPVSLPFGTQATLLERLGKQIHQKEKPSPDELREFIASFSDHLLEDDYVMFETILQNWLDEDNAGGNRANIRISKAVAMMQGFCKLRDISEFVPTLFGISGLKDMFSPVDGKELAFIDAYMKRGLDDSETEEYETWLRNKGYHAAADRLMAEWRDTEDEDKTAAAQG